MLIASVPGTMCFLLPKPAEELVGSSLSVDAKPPVLSMCCPATWLPDPHGLAQPSLTACLDPAG